MEFISFNNPYGIPEGSQFEPPKPTKKEFRYGKVEKYYIPTFHCSKYQRTQIELKKRLHALISKNVFVHFC